jgi:hypothetical protein
MPDVCETYSFATRRELKNFLLERAGQDDGGMTYVGLSIKAISWMAAHAWRSGDAILPYGLKGQDNKPYCYELSSTTRKDYLERLKNDN